MKAFQIRCDVRVWHLRVRARHDCQQGQSGPHGAASRHPKTNLKRTSGLVRHAAEELARSCKSSSAKSSSAKSSSALENLFPKTPVSANISGQHAM
jgi:hypothetical protein